MRLKTRMRICLAIIAIMVTSWQVQQVIGDEPKPVQQHSIVVSAGAGTYTLGSTKPIQVSYHNGAEQPWTVLVPLESTTVYLECRHRNQKEHASFQLCPKTIQKHTLPDGTTHTIISHSAAGEMSIPPGEDHLFQVGFPDFLNVGIAAPGHWTIWIRDSNQELESNRIEVPLRFTIASVATCLKIARNAELAIYYRKQYGRWLQRIDPELKLNWPDDRDSKEVKANHEVGLQRSLKEFSVFWKDAQDTPEVAEQIATINREAGLEPMPEINQR